MRAELDDLDYSIRINSEGLARLHEKRARLLEQIERVEAQERDDRYKHAITDE